MLSSGSSPSCAAGFSLVLRTELHGAAAWASECQGPLLLAAEAFRNSYGFQKRIGGGYLAFGLLACFGLRLLYKGLRNDIFDWIGERNAPRWSYLVFGVLCQLPLLGFIALLRHQGYFEK